MITLTQISWAKCPHCNCLINGWDYYPASIFENKGRHFWTEVNCPGSYPSKSCGKKFLVKLAVKGEILAERYDDEK